jgi:Holliday junction resolvase RusA-like endonuclease
MNKINIKPLSINEAWQGRRFKSPKYKVYEANIMLLLPKITIPPKNWLIIYYVGYSNVQSDIDNFVKPFQDCLQKKYDINDRYIYAYIIEKHIVPKGEEYIQFEILHIDIEDDRGIKKPLLLEVLQNNMCYKECF